MTQSLPAYRAASLIEVADITCIQQQERLSLGRGRTWKEGTRLQGTQRRADILKARALIRKIKEKGIFFPRKWEEGMGLAGRQNVGGIKLQRPGG